MRIASLTILCLALAAIPAFAETTTTVRSTAPPMPGPSTLATSSATPSLRHWRRNRFSVAIGVWEFPGDTMQTVDWTITATENGTGVGGTANVTDTFISTNQYGYNIDLVTFNLDWASLPAGTYWLNLYNATVPSGDPVYWDENSGVGCKSRLPVEASESAVGTIPSEAFTD